MFGGLSLTSTTFTDYRNKRSLLVQEINELERRLCDTNLHIAKYDLLLQNHVNPFYSREKESWELEKLKLESALEEKYNQLRRVASDYHSAVCIKI